MPDRPIHILLVEDNEIDVMAFRRGIAKHKIKNPVTIAANGREGLDLLRGAGGKEAIGRPYVIFLDVNMPVMNGIEFLQEVAADPELSDSTIFVLTTPDFDEDLLDSHESHVTGFILKTDLTNACSMLFELPKDFGLIIQD